MHKICDILLLGINLFGQIIFPLQIILISLVVIHDELYHGIGNRYGFSV